MSRHALSLKSQTKHPWVGILTHDFPHLPEHSLAIYLHFLDRELLESVPTPPSAEGINEAIRLAYLFTSEEIYTGLAAAWENPIVTVGMRDEFKLLTRLGILHYASRDSGAEFIAARQDLYSS